MHFSDCTHFSQLQNWKGGFELEVVVADQMQVTVVVCPPPPPPPGDSGCLPPPPPLWRPETEGPVFPLKYSIFSRLIAEEEENHLYVFS